MKRMKKGFTIVELVIVIAVIGILAAVLIPSFSGVTEKAKKSAALQEATSAVTVVLDAEEGQLDSDKDYYFVSGNYVFKIVNGELVDGTLPASITNETEATYDSENLSDLGANVKVYKVAKA